MRMVGWPRAPVSGREESPGSTRQGCRVIPGRGNPRESATENRPPGHCGLARVKRWGKSPPQDGQPDWHGKPHPEQCRIGTSREEFAGPPWPGVRVGSTSPCASTGPDEWPSTGAVPPEQNPAYRPSASDPRPLAAPARGLCMRRPQRDGPAKTAHPRQKPAPCQLTPVSRGVEGGFRFHGHGRDERAARCRRHDPWRSRPPSRSA